MAVDREHFVLGDCPSHSLLYCEKDSVPWQTVFRPHPLKFFKKDFFIYPPFNVEQVSILHIYTSAIAWRIWSFSSWWEELLPNLLLWERVISNTSIKQSGKSKFTLFNLLFDGDNCYTLIYRTVELNTCTMYNAMQCTYLVNVTLLT